jgi:hypothetical protein
MVLNRQKHPSEPKAAAVLPFPLAQLKPCHFKAAIQNPNALALLNPTGQLHQQTGS